MVGLAQAIDPRPGDVLVAAGLVATVLGIALVAAAALVVAVAVRSGRRATRSQMRVVRIPMSRPLAVALGLRNALVAHADRGGRASRGAIAAVAGSAAGALAALIVSSSIGRLQTDPSLTGERPERVIDSGESMESHDAAMARLEPDDRVEVLAAQHVAFGQMRGLGDIMFLINEPRRGRLETPLITGRMPRTDDEVALGPETADETGTQIGDEVRLSGVIGSASFRVVGTVLFPEGDFSHDEGAALTMEGAVGVVGEPGPDPRFIHQVVFEWSADVDAQAADQELATDGLLLLERGSGIRATPATVVNLGEVEQLPRQLAVLLLLLGVGTLLHAAWSGVALRARELVTLRALGFTRRSTSLLTATQTVAIVVIGVVVGTRSGARSPSARTWSSARSSAGGGWVSPSAQRSSPPWRWRASLPAGRAAYARPRPSAWSDHAQTPPTMRA
jgi:hypothetical protein